MMAEAREDVAKGRAIAFHLEHAGGIEGLRFSSVGVVEEKEKRRIIADMTFAGGEGGDGGLVKGGAEGGRIPSCELEGRVHDRSFTADFGATREIRREHVNFNSENGRQERVSTDRRGPRGGNGV